MRDSISNSVSMREAVMSDEPAMIVPFLLMALILVCGYGFYQVGKERGMEILRAEAVENGYAEYDQATGSWRWKEAP